MWDAFVVEGARVLLRVALSLVRPDARSLHFPDSPSRVRLHPLPLRVRSINLLLLRIPQQIPSPLAPDPTQAVAGLAVCRSKYLSLGCSVALTSTSCCALCKRSKPRASMPSASYFSASASAPSSVRSLPATSMPCAKSSCEGFAARRETPQMERMLA